MYGHTWASQYGATAAGVAAETWAATLSGLTGEQLAEGLRACRLEGADFPPSAPRFRAMCFGVPKLERVKLELTKPDTASRFTRAVWLRIDGHAYRTAETGRQQAQILRAAYDLVHEDVMRGIPLPDAPVAALDLKPPPAPKITPGVAQAHMAEISTILKPTAAERAELARREDERRQAQEIHRALARRGNEQGAGDDGEDWP